MWEWYWERTDPWVATVEDCDPGMMLCCRERGKDYVCVRVSALFVQKARYLCWADLGRRETRRPPTDPGDSSVFFIAVEQAVATARLAAPTQPSGHDSEATIGGQAWPPRTPDQGHTATIVTASPELSLAPKGGGGGGGAACHLAPGGRGLASGETGEDVEGRDLPERQAASRGDPGQRRVKTSPA